MPIPARERERRQIVSELIPAIAELLYRADKGNRYAKLSGLNESARAVYIADALLLTDVDQRFERVQRVHLADANHFAQQDNEQETINRQARQDVIGFGGLRAVSDVPRFTVLNPGFCHSCRQRVGRVNKVVVIITENLQAEAHEACCAADESRFELISQFAFRVKAGQR